MRTMSRLERFIMVKTSSSFEVSIEVVLMVTAAGILNAMNLQGFDWYFGFFLAGVIAALLTEVISAIVRYFFVRRVY